MLDEPKPPTPRRTVAPEKFSLRRSSTMASCSGLPRHLSDSPIWMRMRVRSPSNLWWLILAPCSVRAVLSQMRAPGKAAAKLKAIGEADTGYGEQQAGNDAGSHIGSGSKPFTVFEHFCGFPPEAREGGIAAEEADGYGDSQLGRDEYAVERELAYEAEQ